MCARSAEGAEARAAGSDPSASRAQRVRTTPPSLATGGVVSISELCSLIYRKLVARPSDAADLEYSQKLESGLHRIFMPGRWREHESSRRKCLKPTQMSNLT